MSEPTKFQKLINDLEVASSHFEVGGDFECEEAVDKAIEILQKLESWCNAYPEKMFPPPTKIDWVSIHSALKRHGFSGSVIAADCMRHTVNGFKKVLHDD